jgi:Domain of unknown function (DUF4296)
MTRFTLLLLILYSLIAGSCSSRKNKLDQSNLIPEKELVSVLTDLYLTDGLLNLPKIRNRFSSLDSSSSYIHVIEKHGYSKTTMDKTMKYYFIKNPRKLIKIYDQVLGKLSAMESIVEREALQVEGRKENLWKGKEFYLFPDPAGTDSARFDITLNKTGLYTLSFSAALFPDDQSVNPRITAYSCHPDSIETGNRKYIHTINYIKDGHLHYYSFIIKVPENATLHLRGCFYDFDNRPDEWKKHGRFINISLYFIRI